jgi:hypothetical protein
MEHAGGITSASPMSELDGAHASVGAAQLRLLEIVAECERDEVWTTDGCRDLAQWLGSSRDLELDGAALDPRRSGAPGAAAD